MQISLAEVKQYVLHQFRSKPYAGASLKTVSLWTTAGAAVAAPGMLNTAVEELVKSGLLEFQNGGSFLALTRKGLDAM